MLIIKSEACFLKLCLFAEHKFIRPAQGTISGFCARTTHAYAMVLAWCNQCIILLIAFPTLQIIALVRTSNFALCLVVQEPRKQTDFSGTTGGGDSTCTKGNASSTALAGRVCIPCGGTSLCCSRCCDCTWKCSRWG